MRTARTLALGLTLTMVAGHQARPAEGEPVAASGITDAVLAPTPDPSGTLALTLRVFGPGWAAGEPVDAVLSCPYPLSGAAWRWSGSLAATGPGDAEGRRSVELPLREQPHANIGGECRLLGPVREEREARELLPLRMMGILRPAEGREYRLEVVSRSRRFAPAGEISSTEGVQKLTRDRVSVSGC